MPVEEQQSDPTPRRGGDHRVFWWTCGVGFVVLLGIVFIPWDAPMPEMPSDLEVHIPAIPESENAFTYFKAAGKISSTEFKTQDGQEWCYPLLAVRTGSPKEAWDPTLADQILAANTAALAAAEQGLACERYASPDIFSFKSSASKFKMLGYLQALKSKQAQLAGDYPEAVRSGLRGWRLGEHIISGSSIWLEWRIGLICQYTALMRLEEIASDARTPEPALREILEAANRWTPQGVIQGYRQAVRDEYDCMRNDPDYFGIYLGGFRYFEIETRIPYCRKHHSTLQLLTPLCQSVIAEADRPYSKLTLDDPKMPKKAAAGFLPNLLFCLSPNSGGRHLCIGIIKRYKTDNGWGLVQKYLLESHVAGLRLKAALRLYEMKRGELPDRLEALVPEYLPAIPADPYDGQPFRYSKSERKVWAIGKDLKDQGGLMESPQAITIMDDSYGYDLVMPLDVREMKPNLAKPKTPDKAQETCQP